MRPMIKPMFVLLLVAAAAAAAIALLVLLTSIRQHKGTSPQRVRHLVDIPAAAWARLAGKTIFFGHHSVGSDIVQGLQDLRASQVSLKLNIVKTKELNKIEGPMLAHASVGENLHPESKIAEFKALLEGGLGERVDIAFFKFCFVDVTTTSDPNALLSAYCKAMDSLKSRFPDVVFVYVTVPLCGPPGKLKGMLKAGIKRLIGRPHALDENQVRARFNSLLRERFSGKEPLFDLALYETLGPDGLRRYSLRNGQEVPILARSYTDDGGHLNARGRRHVAEQLLIELLDLTDNSQ